MKKLRNTTPASNLAPDKLEEMMKIAWDFYLSTERDLVKHAKSKLGRQTRTFTGEFRYYLWEFPTFTIWVANGKGVDVEVIPTLTSDEAFEAYCEGFSLLTAP